MKPACERCNWVGRMREEAEAVDEDQGNSRQQGVVKWFSDPKGYGFILCSEEVDIFVHHTAIKMEGFRTLKEGDMVMYDLMESPKGLQASNVTPVAVGVGGGEELIS